MFFNFIEIILFYFKEAILNSTSYYEYIIYFFFIHILIVRLTNYIQSKVNWFFNQKYLLLSTNI